MRKMVKNNPEYWEFIRELRNDDLLRANSMNHHVITTEEHAAFMQSYQHQFYVCLEDDRPIGYVGTNAQDYISIALVADARGKGVGKYMLQYLREEISSRKLRAIVNITNEASLKLFEACGFVKKYYIFEGDNND
jgi:RimJ/RimL family protein N-acetyltransferase|tara:strand:+ start:549 stop:953 length:405 start_codon:yes stop_codon:yes gene_type:complete